MMMAHERHNKLGDELIARIFEEYPRTNVEERILVLESLVFAFIVGMSREPAVQYKILEILANGVQERLDERERME